MTGSEEIRLRIVEKVIDAHKQLASQSLAMFNAKKIVADAEKCAEFVFSGAAAKEESTDA